MRALYIRCTAKISLLASPGTWFKVVGPFIISVKSDYSRPCLSIVVSGLVLYGLFFLKSFRFLPHHTHTPVTKLEAQLRGSEGGDSRNLAKIRTNLKEFSNFWLLRGGVAYKYMSMRREPENLFGVALT